VVLDEDDTGERRGVEGPARIPERFLLHRPRPNPNGARVWIDLDIPGHEGGSLDLAVYDVSGRRIRDLLRGPRDPGRHTILWDLTDAAGRSVGAGVYFVVFRAEGYQRTEKVLILR
jgi:hypothetical protein